MELHLRRLLLTIERCLDQRGASFHVLDLLVGRRCLGPLKSTKLPAARTAAAAASTILVLVIALSLDLGSKPARQFASPAFSSATRCSSCVRTFARVV